MNTATIVKNKMLELNYNRKMVAQKMNYTDLSKGLKRLDQILAGDIVRSNDIAIRTANALGIDTAEFYNSIIETKKQFDENIVEQKKNDIDSQRKSFLPYICAMFERYCPSQFFVGYHMGYHYMGDHERYVYLDKTFLTLGNSEQMDKTKTLIQQHYNQLEGKLFFFGKIIHYVLRTDFDENSEDILLFDIEGNLMIDPDKDLSRIQGIPDGITIAKGKSIDWMFKLKPL